MELFYVDGFAFSTKEEYNLASHEAKNVSSIRAQLNWENKDSVMLVYRRLAAKGIFVTPVGLSFIKELRTVLVENSVSLPGVHRAVQCRERTITIRCDRGQRTGISQAIRVESITKQQCAVLVHCDPLRIHTDRTDLSDRTKLRVQQLQAARIYGILLH